ncbi:PEP-CTERM sorting domain-containing protein [uncultured Desulfobacter sp.]|uniref:PEP-CTERM sorting domain-containing protein n=1 Tax=uncultured Desulfobacter sp. TaxID=240139 RepID=UPI002AAA7108|nr:PEP-CTERM sorting domain-containing protein [uncultured Desulfobacter sp.]
MKTKHKKSSLTELKEHKGMNNMKYAGNFKVIIMVVLVLFSALGVSSATMINLTEDGGFYAEGRVAYNSTNSVTLYEDAGMGYTLLYNDPYYSDSTGISAADELLSFDISLYTTGYDSFEINLLTEEDSISLYYYENSSSGIVDFEASCSFDLSDYNLDDIFGLEFVLTSVDYGGITDTVDASFTISNVQTNSPVPEPASFFLLGSGLLWLARRQRKIIN